MLPTDEGASRVAVVGSVFLDLVYDRPLDDNGVEPIREFHGGIGRNIAENLGWIGLRPRLVTLMAPNSQGERIAAELACAGVELAAKYVSTGIGVYRVFVRAGETEQYRIEQPLIEQLNWRFVSEQLGSMSHVVVETGLDRDMVHELLVHCKGHGIQVCGIPTRLHDVPIDWQMTTISRLDCVIMNRTEAQFILGYPISNREAAMQGVAELQRRGVPQAVITLGADGAAVAGHSMPPAVFTAAAAEVVNTLGCGDAFTAGFIAASAAGYALPAAINAAFELARRTAEAPGPVYARAGIGLLAT
ncbi:MAG TPA: PfkB family carbohydrate kinase [Candidatus Angelobacter sp.]|nr:PfkB family carbohydrate kinase [Candidatus Angelobacter sp.]